MFRTIILAVSLIALSGCATMDRGTRDYFRIDTVPQGAKVTTTLKKGGEFRSCEPTPCAISVPRRTEFIATIEMDGYEPAEIYISSSLKRGGAAGSMAQSVGTGVGVGALTGAATAAASNTFANIFSFGTMTNPHSTSAAAGSGAAIGLGVGAGMIATDVATGAYLNLYPNPVVIGLAPAGTATYTDPKVQEYRDKLAGKTGHKKTAANDRGF